MAVPLTKQASADTILTLTRADGGAILLTGLGTFVNSNGIVSSSSGSTALLAMLGAEGADGAEGAQGPQGLLSLANDGANRVITADGDTTGTAEENLTFDGSVLDVTGAILASGNIETRGQIIAQEIVVSSSVTVMTHSFSSGSTIF